MAPKTLFRHFVMPLVLEQAYSLTPTLTPSLRVFCRLSLAERCRIRPSLAAEALVTAPEESPGRFWQPSANGLLETTNSLYISNGVVANNKLMMSNNQITSVINVSAEVENTLYEDIQYRQVPVADTHFAPLRLPRPHG